MSTLQDKSNNMYSDLAKNRDKSLVAGRYSRDSGKEVHIVEDIFSKLGVKERTSFLDLGCGYSLVSELVIERAKALKLSLSLMDIAPIIQRLKEELSEKLSEINVHYIEGNFPQDYSDDAQVRFDNIVAYGVIMYLDDPYAFVENAVKLLKPGGRFLLGDVTNINKKGRFLSSQFGRQFEANYRNMSIDEIAEFTSHIEYVDKNPSSLSTKISDSFVLNLITSMRDKGYDAYVLPQASNLPFSYTREDILIQKYD